MSILDYLARASANEIILGKIGLFTLRFFIVAFVLYMMEQTLAHLPYLQPYMGRPWGKLIVFLVLLAVSLLLCFYIPGLRILHNVGLIYKPKDKVWLDIILSGIALSRSTWLWHLPIRWLDRRSSS